MVDGRLKRLWGRAAEPVLASLRQGLDPERAALAVALGFWIGLLPLIFGTMALCALAAWRLKLNHGVIQAANYAAFPFQLLLAYPFFRLGVLLFRGERLHVGPAEFAARLREDPGPFLGRLGHAALQAAGAWALLGLLAVPLLWWIFAALFRRRSVAVAGNRRP